MNLTRPDHKLKQQNKKGPIKPVLPTASMKLLRVVFTQLKVFFQ